jgi:hypothetical protein
MVCEGALENGEVNKEEAGISGSNRKPLTHIRANASTLKRIKD